MASPRLEQVGQRIRDRRQVLEMTLDDLAAKTGLSKSFLSQVERAIARPSIESLSTIATALGVPLFLFFVDETSSQTVVHRNERTEVTVPDSRFRYESIWFGPDHKMEVLIGRLDPGESDRDVARGHFVSEMTRVEECVVVLEGSLNCEIDGEVYELEEGDSIYFNGILPHRYTNPAESESVILFVVTPPVMLR